jgi:hypothetical protein
MANLMKTYRVKWEIDIEADSALEAVKEALRIQRENSTDTCSWTKGTLSWNDLGADNENQR